MSHLHVGQRDSPTFYRESNLFDNSCVYIYIKKFYRDDLALMLGLFSQGRGCSGILVERARPK